MSGNNTGEPCHARLRRLLLHQAWRWNLDYVVDLHGNTMSLWYGTGDQQVRGEQHRRRREPTSAAATSTASTTAPTTVTTPSTRAMRRPQVDVRPIGPLPVRLRHARRGPLAGRALGPVLQQFDVLP